MPNKFGKARNWPLVLDVESGSEVVPKGKTEFGAGLCEAEESVSAIPTGVTARPAADLAFGDMTADVVLRSVCMQWNLWPLEDDQQLGLIGS